MTPAFPTCTDNTFQGNDINEVPTSEVGVLHLAEEESLNQLDARLIIQSGESQNVMSDDSELAEEAVRNILDTPDMDTEVDKGADHFPDEEVKPCQSITDTLSEAGSGPSLSKNCDWAIHFHQ